MVRHLRRRQGQRPRLSEEPPAELDFEKGDSRGGRAGVPRPDEAIREEFPPARERQAGMTGGETEDAGVDGGVTADDLAPETLLDQDRSHSPAAEQRRGALDARLRDAGAAQIGAGSGKDEAELAREHGLDDESYEDEPVRKRRR